MRKSESLAELLTKEQNVQAVVIGIWATDETFLEIKTDARYVRKPENIGTIDSEELGVIVLFARKMIVFESGLGGVYKDFDREEIKRLKGLRMVSVQCSLQDLVEKVYEVGAVAIEELAS